MARDHVNGYQNGIKGAAVTVLLGAQWGDEGKGKIIDFLIQHHQVDRFRWYFQSWGVAWILV